MLNGKSILVTGGTGSFGRECIHQILKRYKPARLIVFSRDELKQSEMQQDPRFHSSVMRYFLGDVRDLERLNRAFRGVDFVIHAAAQDVSTDRAAVAIASACRKVCCVFEIRGYAPGDAPRNLPCAMVQRC